MYDESGWKLLKAAEDLIRASQDVPDFRYDGPLAIGETWAFTMCRCRGCAQATWSDFWDVYADLYKRFPNDVEVVRWSHWMISWGELLAVRMLDDGLVTSAGAAILAYRAQWAVPVYLMK